MHYGVPNVAAAVPRTGSYAFTSNLLPYLAAVAGRGVGQAVSEDPGLAKGVYFYGGACTHPRLSRLFELEYSALDGFIGR